MQFLSTKETMEAGQTLAVADRILIDPEPGRLAERTIRLLDEIASSGCVPRLICEALIRLGMNFAGRDTSIVGYGSEEADAAFELVAQKIGQVQPAIGSLMGSVVGGILADMKSVNRADSLPGLLAERIELRLDSRDPGMSFLRLFKDHLRGDVYWRMIGESYAKFGNDYARGLEYLRHLGFCQVSTNPVLAAKAFDENPKLTEELKIEIRKHQEWINDPEAHADAMALAATLIALWPNLAVFRPLALHARLKDFMVSFQLNPNIADDADLSITDAKRAYRLAADYLKHYDEWLGLGARAGEIGPNIVFKVAASSQAARTITRELNREGIGTNNTVVYSVGQEVQLILDAFSGKAEACKQGKQITRTYETNMGGRFVSHLREVVAEQLFLRVAGKVGQAQVHELLNALARELQVDEATLQSLSNATLAEKVQKICSFKYLKTLGQPDFLRVADLAGFDANRVHQLEDDLRKAGTLVARRVHGVFYSQKNRSKWVSHLQKAFDLPKDRATEVLDSMDVLPASKRIPEDTFHALGSRNMCHTEFPNQARAVQLKSEQAGFRLEEFRESVAASYEAAVVERLSAYPDFCLGYSLTAELKHLLMKVGLDEAESWAVDGIEQEGWPRFGPVVKTSEEFRAAYVAFRAKCVSIAREVGSAAAVEVGKRTGRTEGKI
jgi:Transaldolase/Fructose-6-phosphate aldolase